MLILNNQEPLAFIKVTFEDIPDEFKHKLSFMFIIIVTTLLLINIILICKFIEYIYYKIINSECRDYYESI